MLLFIKIQTPPPHDHVRSFLIILKFGKDTEESGIMEDSQDSVMHTMSVRLTEATRLSSSILGANERAFEIRLFGR